MAKLSTLLLAMLAVAALTLLRSPCVQALSFELHKDDTKCMAEEIHTDALVLANYRVHDPKSMESTPHQIHARVTDQHGSVVHLAENVEGGQFGFKAPETGSYLACFWMENVTEKDVAVAIDLDWKTGVAAKDWANIAKRDKIDGMELELRQLEDLVNSIHEEMLFLREKEQEMRDFNEVTHLRVAMFSILSLFLCLAVAGFQSLHLKTFFERKKLL